MCSQHPIPQSAAQKPLIVLWQMHLIDRGFILATRVPLLGFIPRRATENLKMAETVCTVKDNSDHLKQDEGTPVVIW